MDARTYIVRLVSYSIVASALVIAVNYFVDPYGITGAPRIAGFNAHKADINDYARQYKKYQPSQVVIDSLIVGNSRAEMGIDPGHNCFERDAMSVYNLAMPGAGVRMQLNYALNVMYQQPIERVFLSVDFIDFIDNTAHTRPVPLLSQSTGELKYLPSGAPNPDYALQTAKDYAKALFSLDALTSSTSTVLGQGRGAADRTLRGFNPAADMAEIVRIEGARALYDQKMQNLSRKYAQGWYLRDSQGQLHAAFDDLEAFLQVAGERSVKVYVFTHPFHESYWDMLEDVGLLPDYRRWRELILDMMSKHSSIVVGFWDFSGESPYISESFGSADQRDNALRWFWEPAHYRSELGDKMVAAMLAPGCVAKTAFGERLL